ncbi:MAG: DUF3604 domain-containing protein [Myxococcota bacterium]
MVRRIALGLVVFSVALYGLLWLLGSGALGRHWGPGDPVPEPAPAESVVGRDRDVLAAAHGLAVSPDAPAQILFGDLHVHTTFSLDAFLMALPTGSGEGAHPVNDACDFARFCSGIDFWSINDHAVALDRRRWQETVDAVRQCDAVAGRGEEPDLISLLGWEWTQMGSNPANHYGHKNVVLRRLDDEHIPTRPIAAGLPPDAADRDRSGAPSNAVFGLLALLDPGRASLDTIRYFQDMLAPADCEDGVPVRDLPDDCREFAATPADLFARLDDWGHEALVIPHGTTWGYYTPHGSSWDKQLTADMHDPRRQTLVEVFSGHGNSEEYRPWQEVTFDEDGTPRCPEPTRDYLPSCWRAGEIIRQRCREAGLDAAECATRADQARRLYLADDVYGHLTVTAAQPEDWLDSGQCRDCFQPAFNYRPSSSVQYMLALGGEPDERGEPRRFELGFIAASDNHSGRPGTGYKEYARAYMTEALFSTFTETPMGRRPRREREARAVPLEREAGLSQGFFGMRETERQSSFFLTGGLAAVHARGRSRDALWEGLENREVYGTSGPRILLWFDLVNPAVEGRVPMGSRTSLARAPEFEVRAVGSFEPLPGCPDHAREALGAERLASLCRGECHRPSDRRRQITRIEVVRIRPRVAPEEPLAELIDDPWLVHDCEPDPGGCVFRFGDPEFAAGGRDALYYVRAIEAPSLAVNADNLRCERGEDGECTSVDLCFDAGFDDDCLAETEERAWSSPIFVDHRGSRAGARSGRPSGLADR